MSNLVTVIAKAISYDASSGKSCPHCKKELEKPYYWLYHTWTSAHEIVREMGWPAGMVKRIEEILNDMDGIEGNEKEDAKAIYEKFKQEEII